MERNRPVFNQKPDLCANVIGYEQGYFPTFEEILASNPFKNPENNKQETKR